MLGVAMYDEFKRSTKGTFLGAGDLTSYAYAPGQEADGRDYSAFGTATYSLPALPKLKVSAGLRYDHAERSTLQTEGTLDLGFGSVIAYANADLSADFGVLLPRFALLAVRYAWPSGYYVRAEATGTGEMSLEARGRRCSRQWRCTACKWAWNGSDTRCACLAKTSPTSAA
jgi:hypothetical protein